MKTKETSKTGIVEINNTKVKVKYSFVTENEIYCEVLEETELHAKGYHFYTSYKSLVVESTREQALAWWNNLSQEKQIDLQFAYKSPSRHLLNSIGLTGREIEEIWRKETKHSLYNNTNFQKGDKVIVFDSQTWSKTGDIGDNSQFYISAKVIDFGQDKYQRWYVDVEFEDGRISKGHFQSGVVKDCSKPNQKQFKQFDKELFKKYIDKFSDEDKVKALAVLTHDLKDRNVFSI